MVEHIVQLNVGQRQIHEWDAALVCGIRHRGHRLGSAKHRVDQHVQIVDLDDQGSMSKKVDAHSNLILWRASVRASARLYYPRSSTIPSHKHQTIPTTGPKKLKGNIAIAPMPAIPNSTPK